MSGKALHYHGSTWSWWKAAVITTMGRLVCEIGAYRDVLERIAAQLTWTARVERRDQTYTSVLEYRPGSCVVMRILSGHSMWATL